MRAVRFPIIALALLLPAGASVAQRDCDARQILQPGACAGDELDATELQLARLVNGYRAQHGLTAIPLSRSLSLVANRHVRDMALNLKDLRHEWSDCRRLGECMWNAPQRLGTAYPGPGYENIWGPADGPVPPAEVLQAWKEGGHGPHNDVILNRRGPPVDWSGKTWRALGIGIHQGYVAMWVGEEADPAGAATVKVPAPEPQPLPAPPPKPDA